eukprot:15328416-Ditylum_brightwellii.AAC.1
MAPHAPKNDIDTGKMHHKKEGSCQLQGMYAFIYPCVPKPGKRFLTWEQYLSCPLAVACLTA